MSREGNDDQEDEYMMDDWDNDEQIDNGEEDILVRQAADIDSRRRLEDRLEERRLQREMREYDFDF